MNSLPVRRSMCLKNFWHTLARGISVTLDIDRHLPEVRGDDTQLQQVMINLLQNAFDAVEGCDAQQRVVSLKIRAAPREGEISIDVSDRGPGLKADQVGDVFKPSIGGQGCRLRPR